MEVIRLGAEMSIALVKEMVYAFIDRTLTTY